MGRWSRFFGLEGTPIYPPGWFGGHLPGPAEPKNLAECVEREAREARKRAADAVALREVVQDPACWSSDGVEFPPPPWSKRLSDERWRRAMAEESMSRTAWDINTLEAFRHRDETTHVLDCDHAYPEEADNPFWKPRDGDSPGRHALNTADPFSQQRVMRRVRLYEQGWLYEWRLV